MLPPTAMLDNCSQGDHARTDFRSKPERQQDDTRQGFESDEFRPHRDRRHHDTRRDPERAMARMRSKG
jgi:hypothetical protein